MNGPPDNRRLDSEFAAQLRTAARQLFALADQVEQANWPEERLLREHADKLHDAAHRLELDPADELIHGDIRRLMEGLTVLLDYLEGLGGDDG